MRLMPQHSEAKLHELLRVKNYPCLLVDCVRFSVIALSPQYEEGRGNYKASIVLAWFEMESWIIEVADGLGIATTYVKKNGETRMKYIKDILKLLPDGTTVKVNFSDIDTFREVRNRIAHRNFNPLLRDSVLAIRCLMYVIKMKSGLNLNVDEGMPPTISL